MERCVQPSSLVLDRMFRRPRRGYGHGNRGCSDRHAAPDRIALARELLDGAGRVVAPDCGEIAVVDADTMERMDGWNDCRAAMLGDEG